MSIVGWSDEMDMDGVGCIRGANLLDDLTPQQLAVPFEEEYDFQQLYSSDGLSFNSTLLEPNSNTNMGSISSSSLKPQVPGFLPLYNSGSNQWDGCSVDSFWPKTGGTDTANTACNQKNPSGTNDHVLAERKRRAKLSQQLMALTAIVPGIKKMDKVTILEDTIKYLKQLQEREKKLEKQISKKKIASVVSMKKLKIHSDGDGENFSDKPRPLPQIEVKVSDRNVLIRIHCETRKGVLVKVVEETEKLNLKVVNLGVIQFGASTLDITLFAQMDREYMMTMEDIVNRLHSSLTRFMESNPGRKSRTRA